MIISEQWRLAIEAYTRMQLASGMRKTSITTRIQHLNHLAKRVERDNPFSVTSDDLMGYMAQQNWQQETRRGRQNTFISFYGFIEKREMLAAGNPTSSLVKIKPSPPHPKPVPDSVYLTALARADDLERLWIDLAAEHGLRRGEIAVIKHQDIIQTLLGHDLLVNGKGGKIRTVPLTRAMARVLQERRGETSSKYIFEGNDDGHISPRWLGKRVNNLLDGDWTIHKLRHRAATRFWINSEDPYVVADLMGWANLNMVKTYVKLSDTRLREVVEASSRHIKF